jgi:hypothetical protein
VDNLHNPETQTYGSSMMEIQATSNAPPFAE